MKKVIVLMCSVVLLATNLHAGILYEDILAGDLNSVKADIKGGQQVNQVFEDGFTSLLLAVDCGYSDIVAYLLSVGANVNFVMADGGYTALHIAAQNDDLAMVTLLVGKNANKNAKTSEGDYPYDLANADDIQRLVVPSDLAS